MSGVTGISQRGTIPSYTHDDQANVHQARQDLSAISSGPFSHSQWSSIGTDSRDPARSLVAAWWEEAAELTINQSERLVQGRGAVAEGAGPSILQDSLRIASTSSRAEETLANSTPSRCRRTRSMASALAVQPSRSSCTPRKICHLCGASVVKLPRHVQTDCPRNRGCSIRL